MLRDVTGVTERPLDEQLIYRMIYGGATVKEVHETVMQILTLQKIDITPEHLMDEIQAVISANDAEKEVRRPIQSRVEDFVTLVTKGADLYQPVTFLLQDVTTSLGLTTPKEKTACRVALHRMKEKGIIETAGGKFGFYRIVNGEDRSIDLGDLSDLQDEMQLMFPLGVHQWIKAMPHTIYIIAGETDAGKSAYLLNFAKMNSINYPVDYHSSEMGKAEFLDRLQYFWTDAAQNKNMRFFERSNDFAAAIKRAPDHIHIIDYIQLFDNFFLMAEIIDKIGKALNNGIAFIALQKPKGRDEGLGGERTKDLARLYLSMSSGTLKITKAKNWRNPKVNPNNQQIFFKLAEGCHFFNQGDWHKV